MNITIGNTEGPFFTQWRFDALRRIAKNLHERIGIADFHLDYRDDYHCLHFEYEGNYYCVRYYKIFALHRDGEKQARRFPEPTQIVNFFFNKQHLEPWPQ